MLKKKILILHILLVFLVSRVLAEDASTLYVSLGSYCEAAGSLRENKLRTEAFPFDWLLTFNQEKLISLLENDFSFFLEEKYLFRDPNRLSAVENSYYEMEFRHDFLEESGEEFKKNLQEIQEKYDRRIQRFRELKNHKGKVVFIRVAYDLSHGGPVYWWQENYGSIHAENAAILKCALDRFFSDLNFTLVIVNYVEENVPKIKDIDGVLEFKIRKSHRTVDYMRMLGSLRKEKPTLPLR